jgi:Family of unknown function (DUF5995)
MEKSRKTYSRIINIASIKTPGSVIRELKKLDAVLTKSDIWQLSFFNHAYLIVTEAIHDASRTGEFNHPKVMDSLEVAFANQYFSALNQYATTGSLPMHWQRVKIGLLHRRNPASISLLLGANAHITYDLLPSLQEVVTDPEAFKKDYFKVSALLHNSAKTISASYYEPDKHINFLKMNLRSLYLRPTMWIVIRWRTKVWSRLETNHNT